MKKQPLPTTFSTFTWYLAAFCLPILLWPLAILISPNLLKNPTLSESQSTFMSIFMWAYPLVLAVIARICYKKHQQNPPKAKQLLLLSAVGFYLVLSYVAAVGFA